MGVAALGVAGFFTVGLTWIAGIIAIVFGSTIGNCLGKLFGKKKKKNKMIQEDLFILKLECLLRLGVDKRQKSKDDINELRLYMEKVSLRTLYEETHSLVPYRSFQSLLLP